MQLRRNKPTPDAPSTLVQPLRRPLMGALTIWLLATIAGLVLPLHPLPLLALGIISLYPAWRKQSSLLLWMALALVAYAHASMSIRPPSGRELAAQMERQREHLSIQGRIVDDPYLEPHPTAQIWRITLAVDGLRRTEQWQQASGRVSVWWQNPPQGHLPQYGDHYQFTGVLQQRQRGDWKWAFLDPYRLRVTGQEGVRLDSGHGNPIKRLAFSGRRLAAEKLGLGLEHYPDIAGILRALLLGYRQELPTDHHRLFAQTGTLHIFAISGLHVGIVGGLLIMVLRACGISRSRWIVFAGPLLILYTVATGMRPSAVRACIMALAYGSAFLANRRPDAASAWALSALLITSVSPTQLTSPGFIFSFVIVAGLIRLYPILAGATRSWWTPTQDEFDAEGQPYRPQHQVLRWLVGLMTASLAAWVSSTPLTAHYFNLFSPVGLIGNLFVIPAAFLVVLSGFLTLTLGSLLPVLAEIFNHANRVILTALIALIDQLAKLPFGHRYVTSPGVLAMTIWYAFLFGGLLVWSRLWRLRLSLFLIGLSMAAAIGQGLHRPARVSVLDVGDGHAVLVQAGGRSHLFDTGPAYRADQLLRHLRSAGVNRLDTLILSNPTAPHTGGALPILHAMPVQTLWRTAYPSRSDSYAAIWSHADAIGIPVDIRRAGDQGRWAGGLAWEVLHPGDVEAYRRAADATMVLRISYGGLSVLLMGGAGGRVEQMIMDRAVDPRATHLVIGNQGRDRVAGWDWLTAVQPESVMLSVGAYNRGGYPERDVLERLRDYPVWRTDESGNITMDLHSRVRGGRRLDRTHITTAW